MTAWLVAYDSVQRKLLACYEQAKGESDDDFYTRAQKLQAIWFRLRPSARVEMRRADSFGDLVRKNSELFSTPAHIARAAQTIVHQRRGSHDGEASRTA